MYTCPMHPEIGSDTPGKCPKCDMTLVLKENDKLTIHTSENDTGLGKVTLRSYTPLIVVISLIFLVAIFISVRDANIGEFAVERFLSYFMIGFFITFAAFKLMDLEGFVHGYQTYDLLAMKVPWYGYVYPFIELSFGLAMIILPFSLTLLWLEFAVMTFSGLGVAIKLARKEKFTCACLGTFLKVPLTKITLIEDFGMAALAFLMIFLR